MKTILILIITFHFEAMPATTKQEFKDMQSCTAAKVAIQNEFKQVKQDGWGRSRLLAVCVNA